ncbi:MAG: response regulator [Gammaproteobacteria bacterium]
MNPKRLRALVVDDNATNRCVLTHYLEYADVTFDIAESGSDALESARAAARAGQPFDAVLLDHRLPDMDCVAFLKNAACRCGAVEHGLPGAELTRRPGRVRG